MQSITNRSLHQIPARGGRDHCQATAHRRLMEMDGAFIRRKRREFITIGEGTPTIIMEKNRMQFFREVMNFLGEADPMALN